MGTWAVPYTEDVIFQLEAVMSAPLRADRASDVLYRIVGDDTLFDMLASAAARDPAADVRPLVALTLDEWTNWMDPERFSRSGETDRAKRTLNWDAGCRDRLRELAKGYADMQVASLVGSTLVEDSVEGAGRAYAAVFEGGREHDFQIVKTQLPGVYAVLPNGGGCVTRVEVVYGGVSDADPIAAESLKARYFDVSALPSPAP